MLLVHRPAAHSGAFGDRAVHYRDGPGTQARRSRKVSSAALPGSGLQNAAQRHLAWRDILRRGDDRVDRRCRTGSPQNGRCRHAILLDYCSEGARQIIHEALSPSGGGVAANSMNTVRPANEDRSTRTSDQARSEATSRAARRRWNTSTLRSPSTTVTVAIAPVVTGQTFSG